MKCLDNPTQIRKFFRLFICPFSCCYIACNDNKLGKSQWHPSQWPGAMWPFTLQSPAKRFFLCSFRFSSRYEWNVFDLFKVYVNWLHQTWPNEVNYYSGKVIKFSTLKFYTRTYEQTNEIERIRSKKWMKEWNERNELMIIRNI